jgi:hypothetical protein
MSNEQEKKDETIFDRVRREVREREAQERERQRQFDERLRERADEGGLKR